MTHEATQSTLDHNRSASPAENLHDLALLEAAALLAIHRATSDRAPISPSAYLTEALLLMLERRHVIELASEGSGSASDLQRAIYDPVSWRYRDAWQAVPYLESAIQAHLRTRAGDDSTAEPRLHLWRALADAEIDAYLAHLLRKHGFDARWALDLPSMHWDGGVSLAQMRYVVWASVREGAAAFLRSSSNLAHARDVIAAAVRRRSRWIEGRIDIGQSFTPPPSTRHSLLLTIFLEDVAPLGRRYWLIPPTLEGVRGAPVR